MRYLEELAEQTRSVAFDVMGEDSGINHTGARFVFDSINCAVSSLGLKGFNLIAEEYKDDLVRLAALAGKLVPPKPKDLVKYEQETAAAYEFRTTIAQPIAKLNLYTEGKEEPSEEHDRQLKIATGLAAVAFEEVIETITNYGAGVKSSDAFDETYHNLEAFWVDILKTPEEVPKPEIYSSAQDSEYSTLQLAIQADEARLKAFQATLPAVKAKEFGSIFSPKGQEKLRIAEDEQGRGVQLTMFGMMPALEDMSTLQRSIYILTEANREQMIAESMPPGIGQDQHFIQAKKYRTQARN
jgi:hypothetical protein